MYLILVIYLIFHRSLFLIYFFGTWITYILSDKKIFICYLKRCLIFAAFHSTTSTWQIKRRKTITFTHADSNNNCNDAEDNQCTRCYVEELLIPFILGKELNKTKISALLFSAPYSSAASHAGKLYPYYLLSFRHYATILKSYSFLPN